MAKKKQYGFDDNDYLMEIDPKAEAQRQLERAEQFVCETMERALHRIKRKKRKNRSWWRRLLWI